MGEGQLPENAREKAGLGMKTTLTIDDDGILTFPPELLEVTGWKEGDVLDWIDRGDGSFELRKIDES